MSESTEEIRGPSLSPSPEPEVPRDEETLPDAGPEDITGHGQDEDTEGTSFDLFRKHLTNILLQN